VKTFDRTKKPSENKLKEKEDDSKGQAIFKMDPLK
jgi:hypothetical protein